MIKLCGKTIAIPLKRIFHSVLEKGVIPEDWRKSNVVPSHKRDSKSFAKNYVSLSNYGLSAFSQFSVNFFKHLYLIPCPIISCKSNCSSSVNLALFQGINMLLNSCQLGMKSTRVLIEIFYAI